MAIRFKFRSSATFDSIDLGGRSSISVGELRSKIVERKKLQICADFDLVFSDADTGQAFEDKGFQIPAGASVIIRRVPAGRDAPPDLAVIAGASGKSEGYIYTLPSSRSENFGIDNFDDSGVDLYPILETPIHCHAADSIVNQKEDGAIRLYEVANLRGQKSERSDLSDALSQEIAGENCKRDSGKVEDQKKVKSEYNFYSKKKLSEDISFPVMLNIDLPLELRCSLCNTIFEEAVMIPCCQHSFCNRCITSALVKQSSCPKCSSAKCTAKDLLPNLSLRQAIEHFLEAQKANNDPYNNLPRYAPDGESGIQAKEVSCAVSVQQGPGCSHSPAATGMGSNQVLSDHACQTYFPFKRKEELCIDTQDRRAEILSSKYRKCDRKCYMCGSPEHLIRECPYANTGNAVVPGGIPPYREGYWHGSSFSDVRPYANIYPPPGMMTFDPMTFPVTPFGNSSCMPMPPLYAGLPTSYGFMRMGNVPPYMMFGPEYPVNHNVTWNHQDVEKKCKDEVRERYQDCDSSEDYHSHGTGKSHEHKIQPDKESSSENDDQRVHGKHSHHRPNSHLQRSGYPADKFHLAAQKHKEHHVLAYGRDRRNHYSGKSNAELQDASEGSRKHSGERKSHRHTSSKHCESDCSQKSHHRSRLSEDEFLTHHKTHSYSHYNRSESGSEHQSLTDPRKFQKEQESSHNRHCSKRVKSRDDRPDNDMREMDDSREKRDRGDRRYQKYKRTC